MLQILKKFGELFDKGQKFRIGIIVVMMIIGAVLETVGISLIVPLVTMILDENFIRNNVLTCSICRILNIQSSVFFVILLLIALIIIFISKNVFLLFEYYIQQRFVCNNRIRTQKQLILSLLQRPYEFFLNESTGNIQQVIIEDVNRSFLLLNNVMTLFTEIFVCIIVFGAIIMIDAIMALFVCIVLLAEMLLITKKIKPTMQRAGTDQRKASAQTNKWIIQSVEGIKEIKVTDRQGFFITNYEKYASKYAFAEQKSNLMNNIPRLIIESVTISAMLGLMILFMLLGYDMVNLLPHLSAFAVAAVRLLPSANRISSSINNISLWEGSLNALLLNMKEVEQWEYQSSYCLAQNKGNLTFVRNCRLANISYAYPDTEQNVLEHANMIIDVGKSVGIVGTSGAGKTTAVDILLGLLQPKEGEVLCDDRNIMENWQWWRKHLGYIPQDIFLLDDTIAANIAFGSDPESINEEQVINALREAQLEKFVESLPEGIHSRIGERGIRLSGGQRQRIGIARALYGNPELLIFDEATSALDNETEAAVMESINALYGKRTMIIIAHRLTTIQCCDTIYRIENRKIIRER